MTKPVLVLNKLSGATEVILELMEQWITLCPRKGRPKERMALLGWSLKWEEEILSHLIECLFLPDFLVMNIIVWNCRGALKPNFQRYVNELVRTHNPAILVFMEMRVGGDRAKEITGHLPFDGAIHAETIQYTGGIWLLWNSDRVEVVQLVSTEQEVYVEVKVLPSNLFLDFFCCVC